MYVAEARTTGGKDELQDWTYIFLSIDTHNGQKQPDSFDEVL